MQPAKKAGAELFPIAQASAKVEELVRFCDGPKFKNAPCAKY